MCVKMSEFKTLKDCYKQYKNDDDEGDDEDDDECVCLHRCASTAR